MANPNPSPSTRFVKGQSGNPSGRPKGSVGLTARIRRVLLKETKDGRPLADVLAEILVNQAMKNPAKMNAFLRDFMDRDEGKVADKVEVEGIHTIRDLVRELDKSESTDEPASDCGD